jgi:hypothetical protein
MFPQRLPLWIAEGPSPGGESRGPAVINGGMDEKRAQSDLL